MSRCFPFPPPGYEKKIRTDEADSSTKVKQKKEKKHKKEKKDKEKKQGKEKKDKETSKVKHKERKERKEKHKDRKDKDGDEEKSRTSGDQKAAGVLLRDREKLVINTLQNNGNGESKFIQDLEKRIRNEEEATESQSARKINLPFGVTENSISCPVPRTNHRKDEEKKINTHRNIAMVKRSVNGVLQVSSCTDQKGTEVMVKPLEKKDQAKKIELQEKNHCRENATKSDKPVDNKGIKKDEAKNITDRSSKEKEVINKNGQEKPKFVEGEPMLKERELDSVDTRNARVPELSRASVKNLSAEGILGKRKDLESNGLVYENGSCPNKISRPIASPISSVENTTKLGACQTPPKLSSVLNGTICNPEVKEHRINGFIDPQEPKSRPAASLPKVKENGEASAKKRPHSDLKYLDQILSIPKRKELDDDGQEWLFGQPGVELKKKREDSITSLNEIPQIWNQALRVESADIVALPYVVPF